MKWWRTVCVVVGFALIAVALWIGRNSGDVEGALVAGLLSPLGALLILVGGFAILFRRKR